MISFSPINLEKHIDDYNQRKGCNIAQMVNDGSLIKIEEWHFVSKDKFDKIKIEHQELLKIVDLNLIRLNPHIKNQIIEFASFKKAELSEILDDEYFKNISLNDEISRALWSISVGIAKQPIFVFEAIEKFTDDLTDNQKVYYQHDHINCAIELIKDKFNEWNVAFEKTFNLGLLKENKNLIKVFIFADQLINELKYYKPSGVDYLNTPLSIHLFTKLLEYKERYISVFGDFNFKNINEIQALLKKADPMRKNIFPFFSGLYPSDEQDKIDLFSHSFFHDAMEFYIKKENGNKREQLIKDIKLLLSVIETIDEYFEVKSAWDRATLMNTREYFWGINSGPNLVTEFKSLVSGLLDHYKEYLDQKKAKQIERVEAKAKKFEEHYNREKAITDKLLKNGKTDSLEKFTEFIYQVESIELLAEEQKTIHYHSMERMMEEATYEVLLLSPEQIKPLLIRINNEIQAKFMDYHNRYKDSSKIDFNNELAVFQYKQFLGYSFHTSKEITNTQEPLNDNTMSNISMQLYSNASLLAEFKSRILKVYPNIVDLPPVPTGWLEGLPLFPKIDETTNSKNKMNNTSDFFWNISCKLYACNYRIDEANYYNHENFIEEMHNRSTCKGKIFYFNLKDAMPREGGRIADETKGETPTIQEKIFREVLSYCKKKIDEIENEPDQSQPLSPHPVKKPNDSETNQEDTELQKKKSEIREYIKGKFVLIDPDLKWKYVFINEVDYNSFLNLFTNYFVGESYTMSKEIMLMPECKTNFAPLFNTIHRKFRGRTPSIKKDQEYYKLIKNFNHYKDQSDSKLYKDITRQGQII